MDMRPREKARERGSLRNTLRCGRLCSMSFHIDRIVKLDTRCVIAYPAHGARLCSRRSSMVI